MTETITAIDAKPARSEGITPGRRTISRSGAADCGGPSSAGAISSPIRFGSGRTLRARTTATSESTPAPSQGIVRTLASRSSLPEKIGLKTAGPRIAPTTAPLST
ncbi:MAG TPA: hypothetical protein VFT18_02600 [Gaiellaceae bacterium]|nr:hypothetical protein [Gaiellaceae bacterium]